jgi:hypothetical protein
MFEIVLGCLSLAMAILLFVLAREIRLRLAWQQLYLRTWDQEEQDAREDDSGFATASVQSTLAGDENGVAGRCGVSAQRLRVER